jgi:hypothetical protein
MESLFYGTQINHQKEITQPDFRERIIARADRNRSCRGMRHPISGFAAGNSARLIAADRPFQERYTECRMTCQGLFFAGNLLG